MHKEEETIKGKCVKCGKYFMVKVVAYAPCEAVIAAKEYLAYHIRDCNHYPGRI